MNLKTFDPSVYDRSEVDFQNNCELKVSLEQRNMIVRALECLHDVNRS